MTPVDPRISTAGMNVSLDTLVTVFIDHWRGIPARMVCPACGHRFPPDNTRAECPTTALIRPMILRRRHTNPAALRPLTPDQMDDLTGRRTPPGDRRSTTRPTAQELPGMWEEADLVGGWADADELFPINPTRRPTGCLL